jgi:hypothetical protein
MTPDAMSSAVAYRREGDDDVTRVFVYGEPNEAAREILDRLGASYHSPWDGFSRF